jgi:hypothetical protein
MASKKDKEKMDSKALVLKSDSKALLLPTSSQLSPLDHLFLILVLLLLLMIVLLILPRSQGFLLLNMINPLPM